MDRLNVRSLALGVAIAATLVASPTAQRRGVVGALLAYAALAFVAMQLANARRLTWLARLATATGTVLALYGIAVRLVPFLFAALTLLLSLIAIEHGRPRAFAAAGAALATPSAAGGLAAS